VLEELNRIVSAGPFEVEAPAGLDLKGRLALARQLLSESSAARPLPPDSYLEIAPTNALIRLGASPRSEEDMARLEFYLRANARAGEVMSAPGGQPSAGPGFIEEALGGGAASRASAMLNALQYKTASGMKEQDVWKVAEVLAKTANYDASTVKRLSAAHKNAAQILEIEEGLTSKNSLRMAQAWKALSQPSMWAARANLYNRTKAKRKGASRKTRKIAAFDWATLEVGVQSDINHSKKYIPVSEGYKPITGPNGEVLTVYAAAIQSGLRKEYHTYLTNAQSGGRMAQATANAAAAERRFARSMAKAGSGRVPKEMLTAYEMKDRAWVAVLKSATDQMTQNNFVMAETRAERLSASEELLAAAVAIDTWHRTNPIDGTPPPEPKTPPPRAGSPPIVDPKSTKVGEEEEEDPDHGYGY
tara:strand:- start:820 stop:2070 length:1251 start_codon:yes stop_codon:yes gene_type:complete